MVYPGLYAEALVIDKPVEIVGVGPVEDIVVEAADAPCLTMATDTAAVRGLTLRGRAGRSNNECVAVDIPHGRLALEDCRITSDSLACVAIHGATAAPAIRRCTIHDGAQAGVTVYNKGQGTIEDCDIAGHTLPGVEIWQQANPIIRRCTICRWIERARARSCGLPSCSFDSCFTSCFVIRRLFWCCHHW